MGKQTDRPVISNVFYVSFLVFFPFNQYLFSLKNLIKMFVICLIYSSLRSIMTSLVRLSMPGALLFFISFRVFLTSDTIIGGTYDESGLVFFCFWSVELYSCV